MRRYGRFTAAALLLALGAGAGARAQGHDPSVLQRVVERVEAARAAGTVPVAIFDLDDTLLSAKERTHRVLRDFAALPATIAAYPSEAAAVRAATFERVRYDLAETMAGLGVTNVDFIAKARAFWTENFFSDPYCVDDRPISGAAAYVRRLARAGAEIVYLTGRDTPRMGLGTRLNLRKLGFPRATLLMKPTASLPDLEFKKEILPAIGSRGEVVGVFENEPANLNAMIDAFPGATAVFLDTIHSPRPDVPREGAAWVRDYR